MQRALLPALLCEFRGGRPAQSGPILYAPRERSAGCGGLTPDTKDCCALSSDPSNVEPTRGSALHRVDVPNIPGEIGPLLENVHNGCSQMVLPSGKRRKLSGPSESGRADRLLPRRHRGGYGNNTPANRTGRRRRRIDEQPTTPPIGEKSGQRTARLQG